MHQYVPPLDVIAGWRFDALAVKLAPGVALDELAPYTRAGAGVEFVSAGGELKEAVLWGGELGFAGRCASRADAGETLWPLGTPPPPLSAPRAYLVEPDPAIIRAGLLGELAAHPGRCPVPPGRVHRLPHRRRPAACGLGADVDGARLDAVPA